MKRFRLKEMVRPGGWTVVQVDGECELAIAQFPESTSPNLYQSPAQAKKRAKALLFYLRKESRNVRASR